MCDKCGKHTITVSDESGKLVEVDYPAEFFISEPIMADRRVIEHITCFTIHECQEATS